LKKEKVVSQKIFIIFMVLLFATIYTYGGVENPQNYDAESAGLGFTFVTLNSNGETYFFNPATLVLKKYSYFSLSFDLPIEEDSTILNLSYFIPSTSSYAISGSLIYDKTSQTYAFKDFKGAIAFPLTSNIYWGTSVTYIDAEEALKGNVGLIVDITDFLKAGITGENFTVKKLSDNEYTIAIPIRYNVGLNLSLFKDSTNLYLDLIDVERFSITNDMSLFRFGLEQKLGNIFTLRWGSSGDITQFENYTLGFGVRLNILVVDFSTFLSQDQDDQTRLNYKLTGTLKF